MTDFIDRISDPKELKKIPLASLPLVAEELRNKIIETVSNNGGHLASSLGAVELAIVLHYCLDTPKDKIIWDVGHQAYAHKLLTKRFKNFDTLRQHKGISGFPNKYESEFDPFTTGHSSTAVSLGLGLAAARDLKGTDEKIVSVIGDGSLSGGLCFEALNHAGHLKKNLIVVLNSNEMAISKAVGALSVHLNKILSAPIYNRLRKEFDDFLAKLPRVGGIAKELNRRFEEGVKNMLVPGIVFEELGFRYFGPLDGHNLELMVDTFKRIANLQGPIIFHVVTKKGKGYKPAEGNPEKFHGTGPFDISTGLAKSTSDSQKSYTAVFSETLVELTRENSDIVAISAAMPDGTGLTNFSKEFPNRFFDVGIAEEHAIAFAAGLSARGLKPVVAIYSTFLQRAYDQIMEELALQNSNCLLAIDRAGIVGEDGVTHNGAFDLAFLKDIPNLVIMAPKDEAEFKNMIKFAIDYNGPVAIRYPRGKVPNNPLENFAEVVLGKAEVLRNAKNNLIIAVGTMVYPSWEAAQTLAEKNDIEVGIINVRFIKPLDKNLFKDIISKYKNIFIIEEAAQSGSFGAYFLEEMNEINNETKAKVYLLGIPDKFIEHGKRDAILKELGLDKNGIVNFVKKTLEKNG